MRVKYFLVFSFLLAIFVSTNGYSQIDSLLRKFQKETSDTGKFYALYNVFVTHTRQGDFDKAKLILDSVNKYAKKIDLPKFTSISIGFKGFLFYKLQQFDSAIYYLEKSNEIARQIHADNLIIKNHTTIGNIYQMRADHQKALYHFQQAQNHAYAIKNYNGVIVSILNLGNVFSNMRDWASAKQKYFQTLALIKEYNLDADEIIASAHNNIGFIYMNMKPLNLDSARYCHNKVLEYALVKGNKPQIALSYYNLAEIARNQKDYSQSQMYYLKGKTLYEQMGDSMGLAQIYAGIARNYESLKKYPQAVFNMKKAFEFIRLKDAVSELPEYYKLLANMYYQNHDYKEAYDNYVDGSLLQDSIYNADNSKIIYDMQTKYETNEKEKQNLLLKKQNELSEKTIKQQQLVSLFIGLILVLSVFFGYFIYKNLKKQRLANEVISRQKQEVENKSFIIEEKQKEILDSISYAKRLQQAMLPPQGFMDKYLPDNFVLFKPKDIVSGDFYWAYSTNSQQNAVGSLPTNNSQLFFLAAADSTGHGVPGAMVSLVCSNALFRAVKEFQETEPGRILDKTRELVVETFEKSQSEVKDGMDISLLCIDKQNRKVFWSGANNPLWYVVNGELKEIKSNKQPIGKTENPKPFTTHSISFSLNEAATFYLFTDGFADQFGGTNGKKFKYKQMEHLLMSIHQKSMKEQSHIISQAFENWKGKLEQVDDVCVIGIKI